MNKYFTYTLLLFIYLGKEINGTMNKLLISLPVQHHIYLYLKYLLLITHHIIRMSVN